MWRWPFNSRPRHLRAARSIIGAKPAVVNGVPRSLTKAKGDGGLSRCKRRKALSSSPRSGCVLGVPFLTRRTWSTAPLKSTWSQRRSQTSAALSPCRKATRIMVASRWPYRLALAASISVSTSPGVRCSRVRGSTFDRRVGATVRKTSVGAISWSAEFVNEIPLPARQPFVVYPLTDKFLEGVIEWVMTWSNFQEAAPRCSRRTRHSPIYIAKGDIWRPLRGRDFLDCWLGSCRRGNRRPHHCLGSRGSVAGDKLSRSQNSPAEHQVPTIRRTA